MVLCGSCGKEIRDNVPVAFRVEGECLCCPQNYRETIKAILGRFGISNPECFIIEEIDYCGRCGKDCDAPCEQCHCCYTCCRCPVDPVYFAQRVGNMARAMEWLQSGGYVRSEWWDCEECGGWKLIRKDEMACISLHFAGCSQSNPQVACEVRE